MTIFAYTDGASRGNPGESGIGVILRDEAGKLLDSIARYIGKATNNVAEYSALIECLEKVRQRPCTKLIVYSDSELLVRQLNGQYRVRNVTLKQYHDRVRTIIDSSKFAFEIRHVTREANRDADCLANSGIDGKQEF